MCRFSTYLLGTYSFILVFLPLQQLQKNLQTQRDPKVTGQLINVYTDFFSNSQLQTKNPISINPKETDLFNFLSSLTILKPESLL
jgi:hypothetical protein